ncbi:MAG: c-type cytochrome [Woeseiaceae bacterium]|nr:c-type cytochrome [Woeseiaceae bacterium]
MLANAEYLAADPYAGADAENGKRLAVLCLACHSVEPGGSHMIGPNLYGFFGSKAGRRDGYDYSPALDSAEFVWTPRALDAWMAQPADFLPGNRMTFAGVNRSSDRADIIAYLLDVTDKNQE